MHLGLSLRLGGTWNGLAGAFDPASLFAAGEPGVWLDPSDPATVFSNTAGTTQAGIGDPVALVLDKSGNDNHATQPTLASQPILREADGLRYLEFDGVDDFLSSTVQMGDKDAASVFIGYRSAVPLNENGYLFSAAGPETIRSNHGLSFLSASNSMESYTIGGVLNDSPRTVGADRVFAASGSKVTGDLTYGFEGEQQSGSAGSANTDDTLLIGRRAGAGVISFSGRVYVMILRGAETDIATIERTERYVAKRTGVQL